MEGISKKKACQVQNEMKPCVCTSKVQNESGRSIVYRNNKQSRPQGMVEGRFCLQISSLLDIEYPSLQPFECNQSD